MKSKSLAVSEEYVYWIDETENSIKRANKTVGHPLENISIIRKTVGIGNIISLKLVHWDIQKGKYLSDFFFFLVSKIIQGCGEVSKDFFITLSRRN